jgi:hypothetical protein
MTRVYTVKSNARRDAKKLGLNPDLVKEVRGGWAIDYPDVPESKAAKSAKPAKVKAAPKAKTPKVKVEGKTEPKTPKPAKAAKTPRKPREGEPKRDRLVAMLADWTPVTDLMAAMGWQAHTVRGALSTAAKNLKIKIERKRVDGVSHYRVASDDQDSTAAGHRVAAE